MKALNYDLKNYCQTWRMGSRATQAARFSILQLCADQLIEAGYKLPSAKSLKPKHVEALLSRWRAEGLSAGTLKNRLAAVRDWAGWVGKASILPKDNESLGVPARATFGGSKAQKLDLERVAAIPDRHVQVSLRLQAAFGLRREEALKIRPGLADGGDHLILQGSWCKGGRARAVPILSERQRALLDEARELAGDGSLIPADRSYIQQVRVYQYQALRAGISNPHGLRHAYAQARYKALTGWACPAAGGRSVGDLSPAERERERDDLARQVVADELGHGRAEIAAAYLGGRG